MMAKAEKAAKAATESFTTAAESFFKSPFSAFEFPKADVPAAYRDFAEKGIAQAKQGYERVKAAAEEASELVETTYATAAKGASTYNLKVIEVARTNVNAHFDFISALLSVKSPTEVAEITQAHAKKALETYVSQGKELADIAKKVSADTVEPIKAASSKAFRVSV
ncbi:phasin protein [Variibacter gotjawalensis]|uniref:Phasin protein n=2 Tax=Variibacter gotjawalensis TaxID=1333996 RepID=A0A0S3PPR4_9BRAD|nr:phasin [Variibacter gotjawalensis]BAT57875.1 phasin protein [Variibacter gotjawalensis]